MEKMAKWVVRRKLDLTKQNTDMETFDLKVSANAQAKYSTSIIVGQ